MSRYRFISAEKTHYPVRLLCRVIGVSRAAYYQCLRGTPSQHQLQDEALLVHIRAVWRRSRQTYGAPARCSSPDEHAIRIGFARRLCVGRPTDHPCPHRAARGEQSAAADRTRAPPPRARRDPAVHARLPRSRPLDGRDERAVRCLARFEPRRCQGAPKRHHRRGLQSGHPVGLARPLLGARGWQLPRDREAPARGGQPRGRPRFGPTLHLRRSRVHGDERASGTRAARTSA